VGTSIHVNQLYKGFNWERRKSFPFEEYIKLRREMIEQLFEQKEN
jgi:hypothetical protein